MNFPQNILLPFSLAAALSACGSEKIAAATTPAAVAVSAPAAPPVIPAPPATPVSTVDGRIVLVSEGDGISVLWGGSYPGMFKAAQAGAEMHGLAVGGSGLRDLKARLPALLALKPDVVSVLIGANDLADAPSAAAYADDLRTYVAQIKATGAKVVVGTNLPQFNGANADYTARFNHRRMELAAIIRSAGWIDGVFDLAATPDLGPDAAAQDRTLFTDGLHPTDPTHNPNSGQERIYRVYKSAMDPLVKDWR